MRVKDSPRDGEIISHDLTCGEPLIRLRNNSGFVFDLTDAFEDAAEVIALV